MGPAFQEYTKWGEKARRQVTRTINVKWGPSLMGSYRVGLARHAIDIGLKRFWSREGTQTF